MKKIAFIPLIALAFSCACKKNAQMPVSKKYTIESSCPEQGTCKVDVMKDTALTIKKDGTGATYFTTEDAKGKTVVQYSYTKNTDARYQDDGYIEKVVFEINSDETSFSYKDKELQKTKMLFGVVCFCRGKAGNYVVEHGSLDYKDKILNIVLPDMVDNQQLHTVTVNFK